MNYKDLFEESQIQLNEGQFKALDTYYRMIEEWNKKIDITNIVEKEDVYVKHFLDSLLISSYGYIKEESTIIDIGTGGGFPGLVLKILYPNTKICLMDSLRKRINFLSAVIENMGLKDVCAVHARAEEFARKKEYREGFDIATSRAVAELRTLLEYCLPYVKLGGYFLAMKGPNYKEELNRSKNAIKLLGGKLEEVIEYKLPNNMGDRTLIVIKKTSPIADKYPRGQGKPKSRPLN